MDKNNVLIRKAIAEDAEQYIRLKNLVWRNAYKDIFPEEVFLEMESKFAEKVEKFPSVFVNDNTKITCVAVSDGEIVGLMHGALKSKYDYFAENGFADLIALYIKPEYQHNGIGQKLKDEFEKWARQNGAKKFVIGVLKDNKKARKAYEKWGGKLDSHEQQFIRLGVGYSEVFYTYDL